jgi:glycine/D-amino acid oxidase-like deaminating enzyme
MPAASASSSSADRGLVSGGPTPDLVVVGAGVLGAWTALAAQRAGLQTVLVDAYGVAHSRATSGDETRIIRASHGDDVLYTRWSRQALDGWRRFADESVETLFVGAGALWFAHRADGFEAASERTLRAEGIPVERLDPSEVAARWPQVSVDRLAFALHEPEAGLLMARRGVKAVVRAFVAAGGRFELADVRPNAGTDGRLDHVITADGGRLGGGAFVFACGPWLARLFPSVVGDLIRVTKQDVVFLGPGAGDGRFAAEWLPCWVDYDASFYGVPAVDGRGPKAAPDRYGPVFDPSEGERIVDPDTVRLARRYLAFRFPALADQPVVETRVCQYETTPDTHFIIDRHPDLANAWIVGGGSGHAFKHGPVIGELVASLVRGADREPEHERFRLDRPRIPAAGPRSGGDSIVGWWEGR